MRTPGFDAVEEPGRIATERQKAIDFADGVIAEILSGNKGSRAAIASRLKTRLSEVSGGGIMVEGENGKSINSVKNAYPELQNERYSLAQNGAPLTKRGGLYLGDAPTRDDPALKEAYNAYGIVHEISDNPDYSMEKMRERLQHHIDETDTNVDDVRKSNKRTYWPYLDIRNEIYRRALADLDTEPEKLPEKKEEKPEENEPKIGTGTVPEKKNPIPSEKPAPPKEREKFKPEDKGKEKNTEFPEDIGPPPGLEGGKNGGAESGEGGGRISSIGRIRRNRTA